MESEDEKSSLRSALIQISDGSASASASGFRKGRTSSKEDGIEEAKKQVWLAGPLIFESLLIYCLQVISVMFVGHLGEVALSSASLASSFASVTGFNLLIGMACALDTLCGQAYGVKQYQMLGIHLQRAIFVLSLITLPLALVWANTAKFLTAMGQDPHISKAAGLYARYMIPSLFAYGPLQCFVRFLRTQNIVFPLMLSSGITTSLHMFVCWILVFKSGLGSRGAALANSVSCWINVLLLAFYVKFSSSCAKTWTGFSKEALHDIFAFLKLAIPSAAMVCLESWSFQMTVLLAGLLPNPELETTVLSISLNTTSAIWMIAFGLSGTVSTRVSNELGAGHPETARLAVCIGLILTITQGTVVGIVLISIRNIWGYAYSRDTEVVTYVATMIPILAASTFIDALQCVLSGVARGCGWQKIGAYVNLASYYLVGLPTSVLLAFVFHIGGKGLWVGIICALFVQMLFLLIITLRANWDLEAKKALERVNEYAT